MVAYSEGKIQQWSRGTKEQEITEDIKRVAADDDRLSSSVYEEKGTIGLTTVRYRFGTWNEAVKAAGLEPNLPGGERGNSRILDEELLLEIIRLKAELGKMPGKSQISAKSKYSPKPYRNRWGSFNQAKEAAIRLADRTEKQVQRQIVR